MPPARFEPAVPASDRPQTLALDRSATDISKLKFTYIKFFLRNTRLGVFTSKRRVPLQAINTYVTQVQFH